MSVFGNSIAEYERDLAQAVMKANIACNTIVSMVGSGMPSTAPSAPAAQPAGNAADEIM